MGNKHKLVEALTNVPLKESYSLKTDTEKNITYEITPFANQ